MFQTSRLAGDKNFPVGSADCPEGRFRKELVGLRLLFNVSPDLSVSSLGH